jgi:hypothetical protein
MGLLDDAIREHLELKRRRGADPGEVAREQREALDSLDSEGTASEASAAEAPPSAPAVSGAPLIDRAREEPLETAVANELPSGVVPPEPVKAAEPRDSVGADETAELDMSSVLGEDAEHATTDGADPAAEGDSLEWEIPADAIAREAAAQEPDEDVLEETPDFLRDTPEQERLWFEQRPPRDFDFDK